MTIGRDTTFTWLGHAGAEIKTPGGKVVLIDPWFGNPKSPRKAEQQERCDVLLVTHGHFDHFGPETVELAKRLHPAWPCIHEFSLFLGEKVGDAAELVGMNIGGTVTARGLKVSMVPALHSDGDGFGGEPFRYFGAPVGFVVEMENGYKVYAAGDTDVFGDMALIRELHAPDAALIPIGGHFTMDPRGAAKAVELLGVRDVLPIHWGTFPILAGAPAQLRDALTARGVKATVHDWAPGDVLS